MLTQLLGRTAELVCLGATWRYLNLGQIEGSRNVARKVNDASRNLHTLQQLVAAGLDCSALDVHVVHECKFYV